MYDNRKVNILLVAGGLFCFLLAAVLLTSFKGKFGQDTASVSSVPVMEDTIDVSSKNSGAAEPQAISGTPAQRLASAPQESAPSSWVVYITGAVKKPGVYTIPAGARVYQALEYAGGFASNSDQEAVNLAAPLEDGAHIRFPKIGESSPAPSAAGAAQGTAANRQSVSTKSSSAQNGAININKASQQELESLPGIGPKTALAIIAYRDSNGAFTRTEDLMLVKGIGPKKYEAIKTLVRTGN